MKILEINGRAAATTQEVNQGVADAPNVFKVKVIEPQQQGNHGVWRLKLLRLIRGADDQSLSHLGLQVIKVERNENVDLWLDYSHHRAKVAAAQKGHHTPVRTDACDALRPLLGDGRSANEHFLWHGCEARYVNAKLLKGLDVRTSANGLFGTANYFA
eukprot:gene36381-37807_t